MTAKPFEDEKDCIQDQLIEEVMFSERKGTMEGHEDTPSFQAGRRAYTTTG